MLAESGRIFGRSPPDFGAGFPIPLVDLKRAAYKGEPKNATHTKALP